MALKFTGGFKPVVGPFKVGASYSGGVGYKLAGYSMGNSSATNTVSKITYASDTSVSTAAGILSVSTSNNGAFTDVSTYVWSVSGNGETRTSRITLASDSSTAVTRGSLPTAKRFPATASSSVAGYAMNALSGNLSTVYKMVFASDSSALSNIATMPFTQTISCGVRDVTYAWNLGGSANTRTARITFASDTSTPVERGNLQGGGDGLAGMSNSTTAWITRGGGSSTQVERFIFATDTSATSTRGPISQARYRLHASDQSESSGLFVGGLGNVTRVDKIIYASDTGTATVVGNLNVGRSENGGI